ncbi:hypothetical protein L0B53_01190 [Vibrio sp. SS-MA-C1-2]|uniref:hypothetical protein n=1 Tax=Vibrio sp. SS-MA-C1-2 TaxID=2908646 RepID=UPI001F45EDC3|nr:hypothetical protein [Vibrio sp. SS-MA-C1-2]UJF17418.1 hypothetical protein L0B53_01190 [Vibrio sp. SS-MA-C1-2]
MNILALHTDVTDQMKSQLHDLHHIISVNDNISLFDISLKNSIENNTYDFEVDTIINENSVYLDIKDVNFEHGLDIVLSEINYEISLLNESSPAELCC